ncbi:MAG: pantoate--beta-alanine ligase [Planctomycetaceae bacterium]
MPPPRDFIVTDSRDELRRHVREARRQGKSVGCVPTMGALHAGHISLATAARERCEFNVLTIFVNPTQFAPTEDLSRYPRPIDADLKACREAGVDLVYMPAVPDLYPADFSTWVTVEGISAAFEGASRPTHFRGVTTIVMKLFQLVQPDVAIFGAKDYQQQLLIRRMVQDLDVPVEIVTMPTVREPDGLAMSSRNVYLSAEDRRSALALSRGLTRCAERIQAGDQRDVANVLRVEQQVREELQQAGGVQLDYLAIVDAETLSPPSAATTRLVALVAAKVGSTRLIDNRVIDWDVGDNSTKSAHTP